MNLLFPDNWMQKLVPHIKQDNDFTIVGSISQMGSIPKDVDWSKVIVYNWDHYAWIDMGRPDWFKFHAICKKAREVWIPSHAHASAYRAFSGVDPYVLNFACADPDELAGPIKDGGYLMMSSRKDWYKRFAMFEQACQELAIPFIATHPEDTPRHDYLDYLRNCRAYVQASVDESLGGLSLMEAAWACKPVLMSDSILGGRERYGDTINYFRAYDFLDFKRALSDIYSHPISNPAVVRGIDTPESVGQAINRRICELQSQS